jgi:uncharacterized protein YjdB
MKQSIIKLGLVVAFLLSVVRASAYDFEVDGIAYTITSLSDLTVSVDQVINKELTKITIPDMVEYKNRSLVVTSIEKNAFANNSILTEVALPNTITSIGNGAFKDDTSLVKVTLSESITEIGDEVFRGCSTMSSVNIPVGVLKIGDSAFRECDSLASFELPPQIQSIGECAFLEAGIQTIDVPSSVKSIGRYAFSRSKLVSAKLSDVIDIVPYGCFRDCYELSNVSFSATTIDACAFYGCKALQQISLPSTLTTIGDYAFYDCRNLKELLIPSSVTEIAPSILWKCNNLETIRIGNGLTGLPVYGEFGYSDHKFFTSESSLGSYYYYSNKYYDKDETYLKSVRNFIIDDSEECFSIKGFYDYDEDRWYAPFVYNEIDYYYVGRPLVDIMSFVHDDYYYCVYDEYQYPVTKYEHPETRTIKNEQGTGKIKKLELGGYCTSVPYFYQKIDTLKLGAKIREIDLNNIYKADLVKIECLSETPPQITNGEFPTKVYIDATLYVPKGYKDIYAKTDPWNNFWDIEELPEVIADSVSLNLADTTIAVGESVELVATVLPDNVTNKQITWYSSNPQIAEVSETGVVTGIDVGNAVITATNGDVSAQCFVEVYKADGVNNILLDSDKHINIYNTQGVLVKSTEDKDCIKHLRPGIYIIHQNGKYYKVKI